MAPSVIWTVTLADHAPAFLASMRSVLSGAPARSTKVWVPTVGVVPTTRAT